MTMHSNKFKHLMLLAVICNLLFSFTINSAITICEDKDECDYATVIDNDISCAWNSCTYANLRCSNSTEDCFINCELRGCQYSTIYFSESETNIAYLQCSTAGCANTKIIS